MTFAQPLWFWAFVLLPVLIFVFFGNEAQRARLLQKLVAARLQDRLAGTVSIGKRRLRFLLQLLGMSAVIVSLAQPRLGYSWQESKRKGRDVIIAIDVSKSMLATDLAPNRLERAKLAAQDLISQLEGDRVGLIAFAGSAFLQAPLTADYDAVLGSLQELDTDIIERGGTNIAEAIKVAVDAFGKGESDHRALVLFTDGEELDADGIDAAKKQDGSIRIFTTGLGSPDGSLIPLPGGQSGGGFVKDSSGQIVKSRLDEDRLRKIAEATGGFYVHLLSGPAEMKQIVQQGLGKMTNKDIDAKMSRQPIERYQWPLGAGLLCLAASMLIGERKRRLLRATAAAAGLILMATPAQAVVNPGVDRYSKQDFQGAYDLFSQQLARQPASPVLNFNLGTAAYQLKKDDEALLAFSKATLTEDPQLRLKAETNLGHTLYRSGEKKLPKKEAVLKDWKNSLGHYDQALKVDPADKEVQGYREYVRRKIEELEKEQKQDQQKKDQDKKDDQKKDDQKDQQKKDQKNDPSQQQNQNQKKDDSSSKDQQGKDGQKDPSQKEQDDKGQQGDTNEKGEKGEKGEPKPDSKDGQKPDQKPGDSKNGSKGDEKKDDQPQPGDPQNGDQNQPPKDEKDGQQPQLAPPPTSGDKKPTGDLKAQQTANDKPENPQEEAAAEEQAAAEGRMTERQATTLLDSLKNEDARVRLFDPNERQSKGRVLRDW